jgi:hypothetical protein
MGLEVATYISDLVTTNPTAGDPVSQGDDHHRLTKTVLQTQFPDSANGPIYGLRAGTAVTPSGTSVDFTSIPSWVKRITITFSGVTTSGTSQPMIQIGDSGGVEAAGYSAGSTGHASPNAVTGVTFTTGYGLQSTDASAAIHGSMVLTNITANAWVASGTFSYSGSAATIVTGGSKTLSATLDRVRITTVNGTDTYDGGTVNIMYE